MDNEQPQQPQKSFTSAAMWIVLIITLIIVGVGIYLWWQSGGINTNTNIVSTTNSALNENVNGGANTNTAVSESTNSVLNTNTVVTNTNSNPAYGEIDSSEATKSYGAYRVAGNIGNSVLISQDSYNLFKKTRYDELNDFEPSVFYQDAGTVQSGEYEGYRLVIAGLVGDGPGGPAVYIFATQDYKTFILDDSWEKSYNDADSAINKDIISDLASIPVLHPEMIDVGAFIMVRGAVVFDAKLYKNLQVDSVVPGLMFYTNPTAYFGSSLNGIDSIAGTSTIYVVDQFDLVYNYVFMPDEAYARQLSDISKTAFYTNSDFSAEVPLYEEYGMLIPGACGPVVRSYVLEDVSEFELLEVAKTDKGVKLYALTDSMNALVQQEYKRKVTDSKEHFITLNGVSPPAFENYVTKYPVLTFQDPFGRWIGLGEWEYLTVGGCGKPVVYLYPEEPTDVTVRFENPIRLSSDVPTYSSGWSVRAYPDGMLIDLQREKTNCDALPIGLPGLEYAQSACESGVYPYLYWAGYVEGNYPITHEGWYIARDNVYPFLSSKLLEAGLTESETEDMVSYWAPELLSKGTPYYRISFIQTQGMQQFIPMDIQPEPDTIIRVFLDWQPLQEVPTRSIEPQTLLKTPREGFTVVEWGGLKL